MHHQSTDMSACIRDCLDCYQHCQGAALTTCLEQGGQHVAPAHFRLMIDCAEVCRATAALMIQGSPYHAQLCALCARICRDCAASCSELEGMDDCVRACTHCATACEAMASAA
jgi:hypothetical protein